MQTSEVSPSHPNTGWLSVLSRFVGALLFLELISGLAITLGSFNPAVEWGPYCIRSSVLQGLRPLRGISFGTGETTQPRLSPTSYCSVTLPPARW